MPNVNGSDEFAVKSFCAWLRDKENASDANIKATALHVSAHVQTRGAISSNDPARWPNIEAMRTSVRHYGPNCTIAQFDNAYASWVAS